MAFAVEYTGINQSSPIDHVVFNSFQSGGGGVMTPYTADTTAVNVSGPKRIVIGWFWALDEGNAASPFGPGSPVTGMAAGGATERVNQQHNDAPSADFELLFVEDFGPVSTPTDMSADLFTTAFSPEIVDVEAYALSIQSA